MNTMKIFLVALLGTSALALKFNTSSVSGNSFKDLVKMDSLFVPYGPDETTDPPQPSDEVWEGYGFGMGAVEHFAYDPVQGYVYTQSEEGPYVTVIDYSKLPAEITPYSLDLSEFDSDIKDVAVCPEEGLLFIVASDYNHVLMYETVKRSDPKRPEKIQEFAAGERPDNIRLNNDCSILAVANENGGDALAAGEIHLVTNLRQNGSPTIQKVSLMPLTSGGADEYLLSHGVHMPLTLNALEYWDEYSEIRDDVDWEEVRDQYDPALFMQPEFMLFSDDSSELFVNLQENSALLRVDVATASAKSIDGYGLKEWTTGDGIDIIKDSGCETFVTNPVLYSTRAPDGIAVVEIDETVFILTADEGSDQDYGEYEEKMGAGDLFDGLVLGQRQFVAADGLFNTTNSSIGLTANFNSQCEANGLEWCADGLDISLGSSGVNYTNPAQPVVERVVAFGGRGISIFRIPRSFNEGIDRVWDSGSQFEKEGCTAFPWSHNGVQDENYAPVDGTRYELLPEERDGLDEMNDPLQDGCEDAGDGNAGACPISETIDEKATEDGLAPESIVVAITCDRVLAISCGENNGDCFIYDITEIGEGKIPVLKKVFNLSPASETKSPGVAYEDRTLGDIDAEAILFVPANESPTGKDAMMFGGAHSGTLSFWEFECTESVDPVDTVFVGAQENDDSGLSGGAIAGIVIGALVLVAAAAFFFLRSRDKKELSVTSSEQPEPVLS